MTIFRTFFLLILVVLFFSSCKRSAILHGNDHSLGISDSVILEKYMFEQIRAYIDGDNLMSEEELDSMIYEYNIYIGGSFLYSPDSLFKIFTVEMEGRGLYNDLNWNSWIHFNLKAREEIIKVDFEVVDSIYVLPDKKYLVVVKSEIRLASVLAVECMGAHLISFSSDSMITHPVKYRQEDHFSFCQENGVESDCRPYITYSGDKKMLEYCYGNNYAYWMSLNIDTLRQGAFNYINGRFELVEEIIRVNDRELDEE